MPSVSKAAPSPKTELKARYRLAFAEYVAALELSTDGGLGAIGLGDGRLVGFDPSTGRELFGLDAHPGGVLALAIAPSGDRLASCGQAPTAKLWSRTGHLLRELPGGASAWVEHVAWSPDGERLATAAGKRVRVWSADGAPIVEADPLESTVTGLAWRADGKQLAATCYGGVHLLPMSPGEKPRHLGWKGSLVSLGWSPDAKIVACGSQDCSVHFWRLSTGRDSEMTGYPFKPKALAWDSESQLLATSGHASITVWDFRGKGPEGSRPLLLEAHKGACTRLAFHPRKGLLASGSQDTSVLVWEPRRRLQPTRFAFLEDEVTALRWSARDPLLVGADASGAVCVWEVA
jgi:WD40 repeat protein